MNNMNLRYVAILLICFSVSAFFVTAQTLSQQQAVQIALEKNQSVKAAEYSIDYYRQLKKTGSDIGKLNVMWMHGQFNSIQQDDNFTFTQTIPFPTTLINQVKLGKEHVAGSQKNLVVIQNEIAYQVKSTYEQLLYFDALHRLLESQDSLFQDFSRAAGVRFKTGESNLLEKTTAESQLLEIRNQLRINQTDLEIAATRLQALLKAEQPMYHSEKLTKRQLVDSSNWMTNPQLSYVKQQVNVSKQVKRVENNKLLPDFSVGFFTQSLTGFQNTNGQDVYFPSSKSFQGFQLGLSIPLWVAPQLARAKSAGIQEEIMRSEAEQFETNLKSNFAQAQKELAKNQASVLYYESSALLNANLMITQSGKAYRAGEIGYVEYLQSLKTALSMKSNYLLSLTQYNQSVLKIEYLLGKF
jgi:heavy metal efflux system protein